MKAMRVETFSSAFDPLYERCKRCAEAVGDSMNDNIIE
jgi:hypothetical protein